MSSTIALAVLSVALLGYHVWKDREHRRQIEQLQLLLKAKDVPEFVQAQTPTDEPDDVEPAPDLVYPENADPATLIKAVRSQQ